MNKSCRLVAWKLKAQTLNRSSFVMKTISIWHFGVQLHIFVLENAQKMLKASFLLVFVFLICFSEIENFVFLKTFLTFYMRAISFGFFDFPINWHLTTYCWLSGGSEKPENLLCQFSIRSIDV